MSESGKKLIPLTVGSASVFVICVLDAAPRGKRLQRTNAASTGLGRTYAHNGRIPSLLFITFNYFYKVMKK